MEENTFEKSNTAGTGTAADAGISLARNTVVKYTDENTVEKYTYKYSVAKCTYENTVDKYGCPSPLILVAIAK